MTVAPGVETLPAMRPSYFRSVEAHGERARPGRAVPLLRMSPVEMASQAAVDDEIAAITKDYERAGVEETQPRLDYPPYRSSLLRHPTKDPHHADPEGVELWAPAFGHQDVGALEADLTIQHGGEPIGERMVVTGRVLDGDGRPVRRQLVEVWQANAGGRYIHKRDQHPAAIDPNFTGVGRCLTDDDGTYRFTTIKPGPVPVEEPPQRLAAGAHPLLAVRHRLHPADGHPDVLPRGPAVRARPDLPVDRRPGGPRAAGGDVRPRRHRARVVHRLPLGHRADRQPPHPDGGGRMSRAPGDLTAHRGPDGRPVLRLRAPVARRQRAGPARPRRTRSASTAWSLDGAGDPVPDALIEIWQADADGAGRQEPGSLRRDGFTFTGFGRAATDDDRPLLVLHGPARADRRRARRRSSRSPSSPAGCSTGCSPAPTCPATPTRWPPTRCWPALEPDRRATLVATEDGTGLPLRHPPPGRGRDRLPHPSATLTGMA